MDYAGAVKTVYISSQARQSVENSFKYTHEAYKMRPVLAI